MRRAISIAILLTVFPSLSVAQTSATWSSREFQDHASVAIAALQKWYVRKSGLYETTGWWNSGNAITVLADYSQLAHTTKYQPVIAHTFSAAQKTEEHSRNFINKYYDDEGWWALAWISTYDLTGKQKYLDMSETIFEDMTGGWNDDVCGGGIWWSKDHDYKNAIANELFLSVAAHLANRVTDPSKKKTYLSWANRDWHWFQLSGMINAQSLINDGLVSTQPTACVNNGKTTWTYNQGVILGGLAELSKADNDPSLLTIANNIAAATLHHLTDANGILHDECEAHCGKDGVQFKGIFLRNLAALNNASPHDDYGSFADKNAASIWDHAQGPGHKLGQVWSGPFDEENAGSQSSAIDALVAAAQMTKIIPGPVSAR